MPGMHENGLKHGAKTKPPQKRCRMMGRAPVTLKMQQAKPQTEQHLQLLRQRRKVSANSDGEATAVAEGMTPFLPLPCL